jgi:hypothetical protein
MRLPLLPVVGLLASCSLSPVAVQPPEPVASRGLACDVTYPQLPRCECGCAGDICSMGSLGVVVCDSDQARPALVPIRNTVVD